MKKLLFSLMVVAAATAFAADQKIMDIRPGASTDKILTGVEWENANDAQLAAETSDARLADFAKDEASAKALLSNVKGAYKTDPLVMRQIAATSQWVMLDDDVAWFDFWSDTPHTDGRKVWVKALIETAEASDDSYVKTFCLDQLRWCGCDCPCLIERIRALAAKSSDRAVIDFAEVVIRELEGRAIGL